MRPAFKAAADIAPEAIHWLWPGVIPLGCLTLLAGAPGMGKSQSPAGSQQRSPAAALGQAAALASRARPSCARPKTIQRPSSGRASRRRAAIFRASPSARFLILPKR